MNLFRSEEHVRNWSGFKSGTEEGIVELSALARVFSNHLFTRRLDPDYISRRQDYRGGFILALEEMGKGGPFWSAKTP